MLKNVIITGGSGMIGRLILNECLQRSDVGKVTSIVRKPSGMKQDKLKELIHTDFLNYDVLSQHLTGQDVCFFCIGVYTGQVPAAEFNRITIDVTKAFADALKQHSPGVTFCFLSGRGADREEKSRVLFAKAKGIAENYLYTKNFKSLYIFRPGYIYPVEKRKEPNKLYELMRILYKPLSFIAPSIGIRSTALAHTMVETGLNGSGTQVFEQKQLLACARLS